MAEKVGDIYVDIGARFDKLDKQLAKLDSRMNKQIKQTTSKGSKMFEGLGGAIAAAFSVGAVIQFQKAVINTTAEFQKLEAVLTNTLGSSSQAKLAFADIQDFATKTPFSVLELTDSFVKLTNQGFKPTIEQMTNLGDLASSTGKTFDQLAEAIIDAQVGEFERLKEFGVRAQKEGDRVTFTFKGVKKEVEFTASAIQDYLVGLGDVEGVSGAASAISETLGGKINNLGDALDNLYNTIGSAESGGLVWAIDALSTGLDALNRLMTTSTQEGDDLGRKIFKQVAKEGRASSLVVEELGLKLAGATKKLDEMRATADKWQNGSWIERNSNDALQGLAPLLDEIEKQEAYIKSLAAATGDYIQSLQKTKTGSEETETATLSLTEQIKELEKAQKEVTSHEGWAKLEAQITRLTDKFYGGRQAVQALTPLAAPSIGATPIGGGSINRDAGMASGMQAGDNAAQNLNTTLQKTQQLAGALEGSFAVMGDSIINAFGGANTAAGQFLQDTGRVFLDIIGQALAVSMANAITGATGAAAVAGPFAPAVLPATIATMIGAVMAAFSKIPAFARGGQAPGGMALVGERGPELVNLAKGSMITPNHQMSSALGYGSGGMMIPIEVGGVLRGNDIFLTNTRTANKRTRR